MKIQIKHSTQLSGSSAVAPVAQYMLDGELALNFNATDPRLFAKLSNGSIGNIPIANHTNAFWHQGNDGAGSGLDADLLDGQQGSYYWNPSNDGAASGLDADLFEGQHGSYYLDYNNFSNTPTIPTNNNQLTNGAGYVTSSGNTTIGTDTDINTSGANIIDNINVTDGVIISMGQRTLTLADLGYTGATNANYITNNNQIANGAGYITSASLGSYLPLTGGTLTGELQVNARLDVGTGSSGDHEIRIYKSDNNVADHIQFYNGTTRIGEIGCEDSTWLRINQETAKNIYTPRYIRADGGFFVDGTTKGINGSGNFIGGTISGASDYSTLVRSDTSDTLNGGTYTYSSSTDQKIILQGSSNPYIRFRESTTDKAYIQWSSSLGELILQNQEHDRGLRISTASNGLLYYRGSFLYKVWEAGNDGAGSGLDADLVDGLHVHSGRNNEANKVVRTDANGYIQAGWINTTSGTSADNKPVRWYSSHDAYLRYMSADRAKMWLGLTAKSTYARRDSTTDSNYWVGSMGWGNTDLNTVFNWGSGFWDTWSTPSNAPSGTTHWVGLNALHYTNGSSRYGWQLTVGAGNPALMYVRGQWSSTPGSWIKMWNVSSDGSGSGLDADTVDGLDSGSFLRSNADDTVSAGVTYSWSATDTEGLRFTNSSFSKSLYIGGWTTSNSAGISRIRNSNDNLHLDSGSAGNLYLNHYSTGTIYMRGSTAWHAGNDGSGSGLDADTLDGINSGSFLRSDADDSYSGTINGSGSLAINRSSSYTPGAGNTNTGIVLRYTGVSYFSYNGVAAYFNRNSDGDLVSFRRSGTEEGSVEINTARVYFRTTSDYRRKTNVTPIANGIDIIKALKPSSYNWIEDNRLDHGFLAHEIQEHIPGAASGYKDEVDEEGEPVYQKVDLTTIVPFLTAALKDCIARIESLEATVAALQNA